MKNYFNLSGRMTRRDYFKFWLAGFALRIGIQFLPHLIDLNPTFLGIGIIALFTPPIVRRLHDIGYSGWLTIGVIAIPFVSILLLVAPSETGTNAYGPDPTQKDVPPPIPAANENGLSKTKD